MRTILPNRRSIRIVDAVIRLEDSIQTISQPEFLRSVGLFNSENALRDYLEEIKFDLFRYNQDEDNITSARFYNFLLKSLHVLAGHSIPEAIYLELLAPLVDHLFADYEPLFAQEVKSFWLQTTRNYHPRHIM